MTIIVLFGILITSPLGSSTPGKKDIPKVMEKVRRLDKPLEEIKQGLYCVICGECWLATDKGLFSYQIKKRKWHFFPVSYPFWISLNQIRYLVVTAHGIFRSENGGRIFGLNRDTWESGEACLPFTLVVEKNGVAWIGAVSTLVRFDLNKGHQDRFELNFYGDFQLFPDRKFI